MVSLVFIVPAHWNNSPRVDMSLLSDTWYSDSESTHICSYLTPYLCVISGEATITYFIVFGLTRPGLEPTIYSTWGGTLTTTPPTRLKKYTTNLQMIYYCMKEPAQWLRWWFVWLGLWYLKPLSTIFQLYCGSRLVLLVEETGVPWENHRPVASHWQSLSHNFVSSTLPHKLLLCVSLKQLVLTFKLSLVQIHAYMLHWFLTYKPLLRFSRCLLLCLIASVWFQLSYLCLTPHILRMRRR